MIVYNKTKKDFQKDILSGNLFDEIKDKFKEYGINAANHAEYVSWSNSLPRMANILADDRIDNDVQIAIEFQIPLTSKRVDFMIAGMNEDKNNIVVIELKQWEKCSATSRENVVQAFTGGALRDVAHPSQQAYAYAKMIENFNETVQNENISLYSCAYLHNFKKI